MADPLQIASSNFHGCARTCCPSKRNGAKRYRAPRREYFNSFSGKGNFVALFEGDNRLFPTRRLAGLAGALSAEFSAHIQGVDLRDLDFEQFLNRSTDLGFVRTAIGHDRVLVEILALARTLFGQPDGLDDFK